MTEHDLKEMKNLGAELGAAKAEAERLRTALKDLIGLAEDQICQHHNTHRGGAIWEICDDCGMKWADDMGGRPEFMWPDEIESARTALSHQAEPTDTYTAVDMATAAAQGFRDGQAAVEPATAQDEREAVLVVGYAYNLESGVYSQYPGEDWSALMTVAQHESIVAALTRPAQTEQPEQSGPVNKLRALAEIWDQNADEADEFGNAQAAEALRLAAFELRAALSAKRAGKFRMGDLVKKSTGSEWEGRVVGWYSTEQTAEGYAVESSAHRNSVQIYPAKALEAVE